MFRKLGSSQHSTVARFGPPPTPWWRVERYPLADPLDGGGELASRVDAGVDVQSAGKAVPPHRTHSTTGTPKSEWSIVGPGRPGAAWAVPAVSPKPASATPPESSAPTIIFLKLWLVFMLCSPLVRRSRWTAVVLTTRT